MVRINASITTGIKQHSFTTDFARHCCQIQNCKLGKNVTAYFNNSIMVTEPYQCHSFFSTHRRKPKVGTGTKPFNSWEATQPLNSHMCPHQSCSLFQKAQIFRHCIIHNNQTSRFASQHVQSRNLFFKFATEYTATV